MKWLVLLVVCALAAGGLFWFAASGHDRQDTGPADVEWAGPTPTAPKAIDDGMIRSEGTLTVGVYGSSGGAPKDADDAWRTKHLRWPEDATRTTGKVLLDAIAGQVSVRFSDARSQRAFEGTEFLDRVPRDEQIELLRLGEIVEPFGFMVEDRGAWLLIGKPGP